MIWAESLDRNGDTVLRLEVAIDEYDEISLALQARVIGISPSDARRLAAALMNAADQLEDITA